VKWNIDSFETDGRTYCAQCGKLPAEGKTMGQWSHYTPEKGGVLYTFCLKCVAQFGDMLKIDR
jgi:hypothetical protein